MDVGAGEEQDLLVHPVRPQQVGDAKGDLEEGGSYERVDVLPVDVRAERDELTSESFFEVHVILE